MKYLVVGSGGREHAICYKLSICSEVEKIYVWPGNDGIGLENKCEILSLRNEEELLKFSIKEKIDTAIIGPENYLVNGIVDRLNENGIKTFGPSKKSAILEGSKVFAKKLMQKYGISSAGFYEANSYEDTIDYIKSKNEYPIVIKADGLAAGKGVKIAYNFDEARQFCHSLYIEKIFGDSGQKVVIEKYLKGFEASIIVLCDGNRFKPLLSAKDHKQVFDGNNGPNTGGMGAVAPNPFLDDKNYEKFIENILNPTFNALKKEDLLYKGALFFGIMITDEGPYLLEYNIRFGDPETQVVLFSLKNNFHEVIQKTIEGKLDNIILEWEEGYSVGVVLASKGYPETFEKNFPINGLSHFIKHDSEVINKDHKKLDEKSKIFFSAVKKQDNKILTNGGRVITVVDHDNTLEKTRNKVYNSIKKINFANMHYRNDIGIIK